MGASDKKTNFYNCLVFSLMNLWNPQVSHCSNFPVLQNFQYSTRGVRTGIYLG